MGNKTCQPKTHDAENMKVEFNFQGKKFEGTFTGNYFTSSNDFYPIKGQLKSKDGVIYDGFFTFHYPYYVQYMKQGTVINGNTHIYGTFIEKDKKIVPHGVQIVKINPDATDSSFTSMTTYYDCGVPISQIFYIDKKDMIILCDEFPKNIERHTGNVVETNHKNKTMFYGEYKNGKRHGFGIGYEADETKFEGEYRNGKRFGVGVETSPDKKQKRGYWINDEFINNNGDVENQVVA